MRHKTQRDPHGKINKSAEGGDADKFIKGRSGRCHGFSPGQIMLEKDSAIEEQVICQTPGGGTTTDITYYK